MALDRDQGDTPLYTQICEGLITVIERGWIEHGARLPSTRKLAEELGVSRNTVVLAFEQLAAEGYIDTQVGAGTFVAHDAAPKAPARPLRMNPALAAAGDIGQEARIHANLADVPATLRHMRRPVAFRANFPAIDQFPLAQWARTVGDVFRSMSGEQANHLLGEGDPQGLHALREEIAIHVARTRGIVCTASEVVIFAGAQQAVDICARLLLMEGDRVACEDPGYDGIYASATAAGAKPVPVPVDEDGMDVALGRSLVPDARMIYASPSKQFPLGSTMALQRRMDLLDWTRSSGAWILEDDYDCEFRYSGHALPPIFSLDTSGSVIYLGTFSKALFPALRLGYAILPKELVEPVVAARTVLDRYAPILPQLQVARFMQAGHFAKHLRRMRKLYADRQQILLGAIETELASFMTARPTETGLEVVATLHPGLDGPQIGRAAARAGIELMAPSDFARAYRRDDKIILGFSAFSGAQISRGARTLRRVLEELDPP